MARKGFYVTYGCYEERIEGDVGYTELGHKETSKSGDLPKDMLNELKGAKKYCRGR